MTLLRRLAAIAAIGGGLLASSVGPAVAADPTASPTASPSASPTASPAIPQLGFGVGPSQVVLGPTERTGLFTAYNSGAVELDVTASAYDFVVDSSGDRTPAAEPVPLGAAAWLSLSPVAFTLPLKGSQAVAFDVTVPKDAAPGDHYAGIRVLGKASDAAWAQLQAQLGDTSTVRSQVAFPVIVIIRVPGEVKNDLRVDQAGLSMASFATVMGGDYAFRPTIVNNGNVAATWIPASGSIRSLDDLALLVPTLKLTSKVPYLATDVLLFEGSTDAQGVVHVSPITVLPGETKALRMVLKDPPILGMYDYTFTLPGSDPVAAAAGAGDGRPTVTVTGSVTIVNTQKVLLWIVLPIVLIVLLVVLFFLWRWNRRRRARRAEERKRQEIARAREEGRNEALAQSQAAEAASQADKAQRDAELQVSIAAEEALQTTQDREKQT